jgi:FkbM family methyltransferase
LAICHGVSEPASKRTRLKRKEITLARKVYLMKRKIIRAFNLLKRTKSLGVLYSIRTLDRVLSQKPPDVQIVHSQQRRMLIVKNDVQGRMELEHKVHEPHFGAVAQVLIKPGMNVIDCGASMGSHTISLASLCGESGSVFSLEPQSFAFSQLQVNLSLNNIINCTPYKLAASDESYVPVGMQFMDYWGDRSDVHVNSGGHSIADFKREVISDMALTIRLDDIVQRPIQFIKMDIQGFELRAIRGATKIIKDSKPIIFFECEQSCLLKVGTNAEELINELLSLGYIVCRIKVQPYTDHIAISRDMFSEVFPLLVSSMGCDLDVIDGTRVTLEISEGSDVYTKFRCDV